MLFFSKILLCVFKPFKEGKIEGWIFKTLPLKFTKNFLLSTFIKPAKHNRSIFSLINSFKSFFSKFSRLFVLLTGNTKVLIPSFFAFNNPKASDLLDKTNFTIPG